MEFFNQAIDILKILVMALGAGPVSYTHLAGKALLFRLSACGLSGPSAVSQSAPPPFWR